MDLSRLIGITSPLIRLPSPSLVLTTISDAKPPRKAEHAWLLAEFAATSKVTKDLVEVENVILMVQVLPVYGEFTQTYYAKDGKPANELDALRVVMRDAKVLFSHLPTEQFGPLAL